MAATRRVKNKFAQEMARLAHKARMRIPPERRSEIARIAATARWAKRRAKAEATSHG
jgi:hypothetical protein